MHESQNQNYIFQYGPTVGTHDYAVAVASFLSKGYKDIVDPLDIVLTNGASGGLHMILTNLLDMSAVVFVDEVTYMIALECFGLFSGMRIVPVPMTSDGVNVVELRRLIKKHKFQSTSNKLFWGMYYTIPTFHNPTGILFTEAVNRELIKISREEDILIACDDVYNLLHYTTPNGEPPKRLFAYDNPNDSDYKGNVISNGSFSKILSPGIRLGWIECPPRCMTAFLNWYNHDEK